MNAIKNEIDKKFDGAETNKHQISKLKNTRKIFNFPLSPRNENIKSLNLGIMSSNPVSKNISKWNLSDNIINENIKKFQKQDSTNNINISNYDNNNINNDNNISYNNINSPKQLKNIKLKQKDDNNFKEFKKMKEYNNDMLFQKLTNKKGIGTILFQNNNNINKNCYNNILIKAKQNKLNNLENSHIKFGNYGEIKKLDITSILELKNKPLKVKLDPKRSSSCLNDKKIKEKIKPLYNNKKNLSSKLINKIDENIKNKTPTKKIFIIESDRNNYKGKDRYKESLIDLIGINKKKINFKENNNINNIYDKNNNNKLMPEENHFKAVLYSQEIKKFNMALE